MTHPGLYLHVPFCSAICPYCDFAVQTGGPRRRALFLEALLAEVELWRADPLLTAWREASTPIDTVYWGGGTPSILGEDALETVFQALSRHLPLAEDPWILFEANPEDVTPDNLALWRRLGVRMLSLGVQSFQGDNLAFLGRRHDPQQARESVEAAQAAGFATVSLDLIYGLPEQTPESWRRDLETAVALSPDHLSCYQLTIHEGTRFGTLAARGELAEAPEPVQADLFLFTHRFLADTGYPGYEVSNFARASEHRSRHNVKYWHHVPYLGLGPSSHSFGGLQGEGETLHGERWWNERTLTRWSERILAGERPTAGRERLDREDLALEALGLALRTREGIDRRAVELRYGRDPGADATAVAQLVRGGYLEDDTSTHLRPTIEGLSVADAVTGTLID